MNALVKFFIGEILDPSVSVEVFLILNPLKKERLTVKVPAGWSVSEITEFVEKAHGSRLPHRLKVYIGNDLVPEELYRFRRIKRGPVLIIAVAEGNILRSVLQVVVAVAAIAVAVVATVFLGPIIGPIVGAIAATAVTIGGNLLINALIPIRPPQLVGANNAKQSITYSIGGARNEVDLYGPVPVILGKHRVSPKYAAAAYTEFIGEEQFLRMLFCWGYGPLAISSIKIGETPIEQFEDVEIETRLGTLSDSNVTLFPTEVVQQDLSVVLLSVDGVQLRTTATLIDEISVDVVAPNGINRVNATSGALEDYTVNVTAEYRLFGTAGAWLSLGSTIIFTSRLRDAIRKTLRKVVTRGQYDVRLLKTTTDSIDDHVSDTVIWTALRGIRNDPPLSFDKPIAVTAIRIRATSQLNGAIDTLNGIVESKQKNWNGSSWVADSLSRNPASLYRWVLQHPANKKPKTDAQIDLATLQTWHVYCASKGFTFDMVRDFRSSIYACLADIAAAGRAVPIFRDGKWSVVWDDQTAPVADHYTPKNSWGFTGQRTYRNLPHGWRVRFINEAKAWQQDERIVYDDGYTSANATLFEGIEFPGVTNSDIIWKHGRFHIAQARLRPEIYRLSVDARQLIVTRGDRVRVQHDVPMWGLTPGRVKDVAGQSITLDEPVTMVTGKTYAVRFAMNDGSSLLRSVVLNLGQQYTISLVGSSTVPVVGNMFMFGEASLETVILRVLSISHADDLQATLTLVDDAPEISNADTGTIPAYNSRITVPPDPSTLAPFNLSIAERLFRDPTTGGAAVAVLLSWQALVTGNVDHFEVMYKDDAHSNIWKPAGNVVNTQSYIDILGLQSGAWSFRVRSIFTNGVPSAWGNLASQNIIGLGIAPANVTGFRIAVIDDLATLSWDPVTTPGLSHYVIRFSSAVTGAIWATASVLMPRVDATSVQVPTLTGTYLIKAVTISDAESAAETLIVSLIAGLRFLNVVQLFQPAPTWAGTLTDVVVSAGTLKLLWSGTDYPAEGLYTSSTTVDLGEIFTSRLSVSLDVEGENASSDIASWVTLASVSTLSGANADQWQARVEERHTTDNPAGSPVWTAWTELQVGDVVARGFQFRLRLFSFNPSVTPVVFDMTVSIDMPDRVIAGNNVAVGTGGLAIAFDPDFRVLEGIAVAAQNMATGDYFTITAKSAAGFTIIFRNAAGTAVARTFDYIAKGYGSVIP